MKKIKIKTNLWSGIVMGAFSIIMLLVLPSQVRVPAYDSGAPSPRIIPAICLVGMLICAAALIVQSLVFKKEKEFEFDWAAEKPCVLMILMLCVYTAMIIYLGFVIASVVIFPLMLAYCGERKPPIYIFTIAAGIAIFFLFKFVFHVSLPAGPFLGG